MPNLMQMMKQFEESADEPPPILLEAEIEFLRFAYESYNTEYDMPVGTLVREKDGCKCYNNISSNGIAIVVRRFPRTVIADDVQNLGTPFYRAEIDMTIGERSDDGKFLFFHVDSRRFEPID